MNDTMDHIYAQYNTCFSLDPDMMAMVSSAFIEEDGEFVRQHI